MSGVAVDFQEISVPRGIVPHGTVRRRSETCCVCREKPIRAANQRTCKDCHKDLMAGYRNGVKGGPLPKVGVTFEDYKPGEAPLVDHESKFAAVHERILQLEPGKGFRAKFAAAATANNARTSALKFSVKAKVKITTSVRESDLEVVRLENPKE